MSYIRNNHPFIPSRFFDGSVHRSDDLSRNIVASCRQSVDDLRSSGDLVHRFDDPVRRFDDPVRRFDDACRHFDEVFESRKLHRSGV